jgi:uncharacterized protein (TIGR00730 family)
VQPAICVYASSSEAVDPVFFSAADQLGRRIAAQGYALVYGGGRRGLMGALARGVHAAGGRVTGVITEKLEPQGYPQADEMIVVPTMSERKARMAARAEAFIGLPGGFGTLEELLEVLTLKQLGYHAKPIVLLNTAGFYDPLATLFDELYSRRFVNPLYRVLYHLAADTEGVMTYLAGYTPPSLPEKWLSTHS